MVMCRLSQAEAEHLMMAPSVAGGWVAVHPDCREAVAGALPDTRADLLAMLPDAWGPHRRPVTRDDAKLIIYHLDKAARHPVYADDGTIAADFAARVRMHFGFGPEPLDPVRPPRIIDATIMYLIGGRAECLGRLDWYGSRAAREARPVPGAPAWSRPSVVVVGIADDGSPCHADPMDPLPGQRGWLAEIACASGASGGCSEHWSPTGRRWPIGTPSATILAAPAVRA